MKFKYLHLVVMRAVDAAIQLQHKAAKRLLIKFCQNTKTKIKPAAACKAIPDMVVFISVLISISQAEPQKGLMK